MMPKLKASEAQASQAQGFKPEAKEKKEGEEASSSGDEGGVHLPDGSGSLWTDWSKSSGNQAV